MDKYRIRQLILEALHHYDPAPAGVDGLACYPAIAGLGITPGEIREQLAELIGYGYVRNLKPGRGLLCRLGPTGRAQINRDTDLDQQIWGDLAL